ncbi:MAG: Piwi domain-containing protein [Bacteroidales bacterium]|jgi:hypothetical protein
MSDYKINILPFKILNEQAEIFFSTVEKEGYNRIFKGNLPKNFPINKNENIEKFGWWSITSNSVDLSLSVNLIENRRFAKHFFNKILFDHFYNKTVLTNQNFVKDTEVWIEDYDFHNTDYIKYNKFTLRIDSNDLIEGLSLLVSYDGDSFILSKNFDVAILKPEHLGKVKYRDRITKYKWLTDNEKGDRKNIFPILNRDIKRVLNLDPNLNRSENKYKKYYSLIHNFYDKYLRDEIIGNRIKIFESGFYRPYDDKIQHTSEDSNLLLFGNNQKNFIPYIGMKEYGPIQGPPLNNPVKFFFIFHEDDKELANKLYSYLKKGYKSFPGLESFVNIQFEIDIPNSIRFKESDPIPEIISCFDKNPIDNKTNTYCALYISRIKRDAPDEREDSVYYRLKEILISKGITSQVIYKNNIDNPSFNFFLPNIAIALLAKLGGIPWRLYRPVKNDLVIGIGADRFTKGSERFVGNAFCFSNDGSFKGFNAFEKGDITSLAESIRKSIEDYITENRGCERLVLHYYKKMNKEEEEPIREVLEHLNLSLPYVVLTINHTENKDYVLFDCSYDGKMPQSGTFIKTKWNEFILCNNTRYSINTGTRLDGFPLPIKIHFKFSNYDKFNDFSVIRELIDQVYQFSRMYWKSVRQRNMPVTIEYSDIIAGIFSQFQNKELEQFARNSLWFL